jgi:hypothetical protein
MSVIDHWISGDLRCTEIGERLKRLRKCLMKNKTRTKGRRKVQVRRQTEAGSKRENAAEFEAEGNIVKGRNEEAKWRTMKSEAEGSSDKLVKLKKHTR